ncbi:hypothetical protein [Halorussus amylolyticus]|uniref:hypothetical protein n=1 Tax=Halorussus amylolyticus TaxID=1126242 RepID=UPI0010431040|nr:hypothetical protein [Halorussus amylolyticus]
MSAPRLTPLSDATGLDVIDTVETRQFSLFTDTPVAPTEGDVERFEFPVDIVRRIRAERLSFAYMVPMEVRTPDGDHIESVDLPTTADFPADDYLLELHAPIKIYLRVEAGMAIDTTDDSVEIEFDREAEIAVGARSYHSSPAGTITVTDDPETMMQAVSAFPSALKTTSPERAWPTLRGHPPRIELGDELSIPDEFEVPDTGTTISIPPEYGHVYTVAPLSYYLGAEVVPGETARLTAVSGVSHHLGDDVFEVGESVEAILKRVLILDCAVRTEGLYPDDLHERDVLESRTDLDFAALYDTPPAERLATYLAVSDDAIEAVESPWHRVTHVRPTADAVELLPYIVNDLSLVRAKPERDEPREPSPVQQETGEALDSFVRRASAGGDEDFLRSARTPTPTDTPQAGDTRRSVTRRDGSDGDETQTDADDSPRGVPGEGGYIPLPETDALEQAWVGDRTPIQGTKLLREAFEHDRTTAEDGRVEITVVCNDAEMRDELDSAAEIYGNRDDLRTDVTCEFEVTTDRLRDLFARESDMFHFIGHIDGVGFQCSDGVLDAATLDETGAKTVLLNGCRSHDQGVELVKNGASAAVVSLADLWNSGAVEVGETLARLLSFGFGIGTAIEIVREYTSLGNQYVVLGDPGTIFAQCVSDMPTMHHIPDPSKYSQDTGKFRVELHAYTMRAYGIGSTVRSHLTGITGHHIAIGRCGVGDVDVELLYETLEDDGAPLIIGSRLIWSNKWFGQLKTRGLL